MFISRSLLHTLKAKHHMHARLASTSPVAAIRSRVKTYLELSKFRLSALVVVTSGAGFVSAGLPFDFATLASACTGTLLCAASACTFNQVLEISKDASMKRTQTRPLPAGRISKNHAIGFGLATAATGVGMLYTLTNPLVAALGAANIALYAGPYTLTKPISEINTYVGGIVGAVPPVMGYYAATQGFVPSWDPVVLGAILYLWQMPHFFALSWMYREDYARGGFQMTAVNDGTGSRIANLITNHSIALAALPPAVAMAGLTTSMFAVTGTAANAYLLYLVYNFNNNHSNANARRIFLCSLWYLPALLFAFVVFNKNWERNAVEEEKETSVILQLRNAMKSVCIHEMVSKNEEDARPVICPKVGADKVVQAAKESGVAVIEKSTHSILKDP